MRPTITPAPNPAATPSVQLWARITSAATSAAIATTEPIERSISPADSAKTIPMAMTVTGVVSCTMFSRLEMDKKPSPLNRTANAAKIKRKPT
jgi:hypothetical protein